MLLVLHVLLNDFERCAAHGGAKITVCPEGGYTGFEPFKLLPENTAGTAFRLLDELVDTELWIYLHQKVNVVGHDFHCHEVAFGLRCNLSNDYFQALIYSIHQHRTPVLWCPYDVIDAAVYHVAVGFVGDAVLTHKRIIYDAAK